MKHESILALGASFFLALIAVVYFAWSGETSGTVMLIFGCLAYALLGGFLALIFFRGHRVPRPEDRPDATMEEGAGEINFFPHNSIWPSRDGQTTPRYPSLRPIRGRASAAGTLVGLRLHSKADDCAD